MTEQSPEMPEKKQEEETRYLKAQARVRRIKQFYSNLITFVLVNLLLLVINLVTSPGDLWFYWVTIIWGIILVFQAFNTFTIKDQFLGQEWEEKKIKDLMAKEKKEDSRDKKL